MTELGKEFAELGISLYLNEFIKQGFDTWERILNITESDFDALGVKLDHRRKLQRRIASSKGLSSDRALTSPWNKPTADGPLEDHKAVEERFNDKDGTATPQGAKGKYRRHPKADENSPERLPSAYVIYSHKMREDLMGRQLSFMEIAKLVGENWQKLSPREKEPYEQDALSRKERYNNELAEYKKTDNYREYTQYLTDFTARQAKQPQAPELEVVKRPKLEPHLSTASSSISQHVIETLALQGRINSSVSKADGWAILDGHAHDPVLPKLNGTQICLTSPNTSSLSGLPHYQEAIFTRSPQGSPWGDLQREDSAKSQKSTRGASTYDCRTSCPNPLGGNGSNHTSSFQHAHRTSLQNHPPPLSSSESTLRSPISSITTGSSQYFSPGTPPEPLLDRALPLPSTYSRNQMT